MTLQKKIIWVCLMWVPLVSLADYGPTGVNDRLWRIALKVRPSTAVTIQQVAMALYHGNPGAFQQHNANGLLQGKILKIPSLAQIQHTPPTQAEHQLAAHNRSWVIHNAPNVDTLSDQLHQETDGARLVASRLHQKIAQLEYDASSMNERLSRVHMTLETLIKKVKAPQPAAQEPLHVPAFNGGMVIKELKALGDWLVGWPGIILLGVLGMFLLLVALGKHHQRPTTQPLAEDSDYDFMGSQEGIPTQFDLARAYIDMGDKVAAIRVLEGVIAKGDVAQKQEAEAILKKIT